MRVCEKRKIPAGKGEDEIGCRSPYSRQIDEPLFVNLKNQGHFGQKKKRPTKIGRSELNAGSEGSGVLRHPQVIVGKPFYGAVRRGGDPLCLPL